MKEYELIREIFNECSRNQMRDVFISEIETDDIDKVVKEYTVGTVVTCEKTVVNDVTTVYDTVVDGIKQRLTFTEI